MIIVCGLNHHDHLLVGETRAHLSLRILVHPRSGLCWNDEVELRIGDNRDHCDSSSVYPWQTRAQDYCVRA